MGGELYPRLSRSSNFPIGTCIVLFSLWEKILMLYDNKFLFYFLQSINLFMPLMTHIILNKLFQIQEDKYKVQWSLTLGVFMNLPKI